MNFWTSQQISELRNEVRNIIGIGDTSFFKSIWYQRVLVVSIPNLDTDTTKFETISTLLLIAGCEFKSCSRQRIFRCRLQCQINMNLVFHISEDGSEMVSASCPSLEYHSEKLAEIHCNVYYIPNRISGFHVEDQLCKKQIFMKFWKLNWWF